MRAALLASAMSLAIAPLAIVSLAIVPVSAQVADHAPSHDMATAGVPANGPALQKRLAEYDPRAVAAARHYYMQPAVKSGMMAMTDQMNIAMSTLVAQQNPNLSPQQLEKLRKIVGDATRERLDLILQMSMVSALDTFTTNELVALDKFYSSPEGASILSKMPKLAKSLPAMMRTIMPDYMNDVKERLKQNGAELKL